MGLIKVYGEEGEKQVVTVSLAQALREPRRIPKTQLITAIAILLGIDIAFLAAFLHFIFRKF